MKIILANPRGFCAGVLMAVQCVEEALKVVDGPLYVYHEIVHNKHVVARFRQKGVVFVESIEEVPKGATVIFSAHGVSPEVRQVAKDRQLTAIDATCPLVTKVHMEAIRYAKQGYHLLLVGHRNHQEIIGTAGEAPEHTTVVESPEEVQQLPFTQNDKLAYLTQTTLSIDDADLIINAIKKKYPNVKAPPGEDICYATTNRQQAVRLLAPAADLTVVVGSQNSSNSKRLAEIAESSGTPAHLIDNATELDYAWFEGVGTVLLTAGASAPEDLVQSIIEALNKQFGAEIEDGLYTEEKVHFTLPLQLRVLQGQA